MVKEGRIELTPSNKLFVDHNEAVKRLEEHIREYAKREF